MLRPAYTGAKYWKALSVQDKLAVVAITAMLFFIIVYAPANFLISGALVFFTTLIASSFLAYRLFEINVGQNRTTPDDCFPNETQLKTLLPVLTVHHNGRRFLNSAARELVGDTADQIDIVQQSRAQTLAGRAGRVTFFVQKIPSAAKSLQMFFLRVDLHQSRQAEVEMLFNRLPIALLRLSAKGVVLQANHQARSVLGIDAGEKVYFEELVDGLGRSVGEWINAASDPRSTCKPEMVNARRDQKNLFLQVSLMRMDPRLGTDLIAMVNDATRLKSLEAQFVQSQKMQAVGQLAGGIAHDFNNLLTAISGYCSLILIRHEYGDPDYKDLLEINKNVERAASLVGQLLAFSRKQTLEPGKLNIRSALVDLSALLNRLLGEQVKLEFKYGPDLPEIYVDKRQLEQVIMNLAVNARDAMPEGGTLRINCQSKNFEKDNVIDRVVLTPGTYLSIQVSDTGKGIPNNMLTKIFEPFYTTKPVGKGTGLGLSTVYGIVKQTGGYIFASSQLGKGSVFSIYLPVYAKTLRETENLKLATSHIKSQTTGLPIVLLVEDEDAVRSFASRALKLNGIEVIEATSAEEALTLLKTTDRSIGIIISDVVMPGMDGPTWVRLARRTHPAAKVIFISGYAEEGFSKDYNDISNAVFLPKPFSLQKLIETVRSMAT